MNSDSGEISPVTIQSVWMGELSHFLSASRFKERKYLVKVITLFRLLYNTVSLYVTDVCRFLLEVLVSSDSSCSVVCRMKVPLVMCGIMSCLSIVTQADLWAHYNLQ